LTETLPESRHAVCFGIEWAVKDMTKSEVSPAAGGIDEPRCLAFKRFPPRLFQCPRRVYLGNFWHPLESTQYNIKVKAEALWNFSRVKKEAVLTSLFYGLK